MFPTVDTLSIVTRLCACLMLAYFFSPFRSRHAKSQAFPFLFLPSEHPPLEPFLALATRVYALPMPTAEHASRPTRIAVVLERKGIFVEPLWDVT